MKNRQEYRAARRNAAHEAAKGTSYHIGEVWRGASDYRGPQTIRRLPAIMRKQSKYMPHQGAREMERRS